VSVDFEKQILQAYSYHDEKMSRTFSEPTKGMLQGDENIMPTFPEKKTPSACKG